MHGEVGAIETVVARQRGAPDTVLDGEHHMTRGVGLDNKVTRASNKAWIEFLRVDATEREQKKATD